MNTENENKNEEAVKTQEAVKTEEAVKNDNENSGCNCGEGNCSAGECSCETEKKSSKKPVLIGAIIVAVIAVAAYFGYSYMMSQKPEAMLAKAMQNYEELKTVEIAGNVNWDFDVEGLGEEDAQVMDLMKDMGFGFRMAQDIEASKYYGKFSLDYQKAPMVSAEMYMDKDKFGLNVPLVLSKWAYSDYEAISEMLKNQAGIQVTIQDYMKFMDAKYYKEKYPEMNETRITNFMSEYFKDKVEKLEKKEVKVGDEKLMLLPIKVSLNFEDMMKFLDEYMSEFGKEGQNITLSIIKDVVETAKANGDFETWNVTDEMLEEIYAEMEKANDITAFNEMISGEEFEEINEKMNLIYDYTFYLDGNQNMRKMDIVVDMNVTENEQNVKAKVNIEMDIFTNKEFKDDYFKAEESYHIINDMNVIQQEAMSNVFANISTLYQENEGFRILMDSFGGLGF